MSAGGGGLLSSMSFESSSEHLGHIYIRDLLAAEAVEVEERT